MAQEPVSVEEHLRRVLDGVEPLPAVSLPLPDCLGLVVAEDLRAPIALPRFDNSAMDGYAVRQGDLAAASGSDPVVLPVVGQIGAGQAGEGPAAVTVGPGSAAKIMTGARIPEGADAVVPYEATDRGAERVAVREAPGPGQHIRPAGDDVEEGDLLATAGTPLGPRRLGLLAAVGYAELPVRPRPRVVVVSTGSELRDPGQELGPDSIFDGNSYLLGAAVERAGGVAVRTGIVPDSPDAFWAALAEHAADADLVITSGGVSMGDFDVVKETLRPRGVWFGPVRMQPGKPQGFGHLPGLGRHPAGTPIVTLPGNPVSSYLSFEVFVLPALRKMMGLEPWSRTPVTARLAQATTSPPGRRQFLRGRSERAGAEGEGGLTVSLIGGPGSHLVGALAESDCLVVVPEDVTEVPAGAEVSVLMLDEPL